MDYDYETLAFVHVLNTLTGEASYILSKHLDDNELIKLADALDKYAALVDEEQIRRIEARRCTCPVDPDGDERGDMLSTCPVHGDRR